MASVSNKKRTPRQSVKSKAHKQKSAANLKRAISRSIRKQGFDLRDGKIHQDLSSTKDSLRELHSTAVAHKRHEERRFLKDLEPDLLKHIANGNEIDIARMSPVLIPVEQRTIEALLFRYVQLHWSIPTSNGYGRRLRFLVLDKANDKVMGIIGLSDPVYSLRARDEWIGWDEDTKKKNLYHVMDAYVLGAVPPYSNLLGTKLMATLSLSSEIQAAFRSKYRGQASRTSKIVRKPHLALITTASALGRSSVYNRLRYDGRELWTKLGVTQGSGDFHFANGLYKRMKEFAELYCVPTDRAEAWGDGFRNRREVIAKCLNEIGLRNRLRYHNVQREIFAAECGLKSLKFLRGETDTFTAYKQSTDDLFDLFKNRWLIGRAERDLSYLAFSRSSYALWRTEI